MEEAVNRYKKSLKNKTNNIMDDGLRKIVQQTKEKLLSECERKLSRTSVQRYYNMGITAPKPRGPPQKNPDSIINAMDLHISMIQIVFYFLFAP